MRTLQSRLSCDTGTDPLRIAVVAPARYPIRQPFAGGLEAFCHTLVTALRGLGHTVDLYASRGSEGHDPSFELPGVNWAGSSARATDTGYPAGEKEREDAAFAALRGHLARRGYDVVHNNSLNAGLLAPGAEPLPLVTTFHTPQLPEMQAAITAAGCSAGRFTAVSRTTANDWVTPGPVEVIPNGVDTTAWLPGDGGGPAIWFGRLVPEKAPHLALDACHEAGVPVVVAGRKADHEYFEAMIAPRLRAYRAKYVGVLDHGQLHRLVASCSVCVVTPQWDEPFGLVAFEAMSCGTPVAAFCRGGLGEMLRSAPAALASPDDVSGLAAAIREAAAIDRDMVALWVRVNYSLQATASRYARLYQELQVR